MSYQNPPTRNEDEETAVPLITTHLPSTTMDHHSMRKMMAIVVAGMLLLGVAVGAVWMQGGSLYDPSSGGSLNVKDGSITTAAEGLVVATQATPCLPAQGLFNGISISHDWHSHSNPFETCWKLDLGNNDHQYCWSKSYYKSAKYEGG